MSITAIKLFVTVKLPDWINQQLITLGVDLK